MQSDDNDRRERLAEKVRVNRLRRALKRQGRLLIKSRVRNPRAPDFGGFMIVNMAANTVEAGEIGSPLALSIDEVEAWIAS